MQGHRPAGELLGTSTVGRAQEAERLDPVGLRLGVDRHQAEATALLVCPLVGIGRGADFGVADRVDVHPVPQRIAELPGVREAMARPVPVRRSDLVRAPPARVTGADRGRAERPAPVALRIGAVLDEGRQVLVAADVQALRSLKNAEEPVARSLRPAAAVEIGNQVVVVAAVVRGDAREHGLAEQHLHRVAAPVAGPLFQELLLARAEQGEPGLVKSRRVDILVQHVVRPPRARVHMFRAALELPVGEDREPHAAVDHVAVVDADVLLDRRRVERVGVVRGVRPVDRVDHPRRLPVAAE